MSRVWCGVCHCSVRMRVGAWVGALEWVRGGGGVTYLGYNNVRQYVALCVQLLCACMSVHASGVHV